jgi:hypothetical protein
MPHTAALRAQPRCRVIAELEAGIDQAERTLARCRLDLEDALAAGRRVAYAEGMLQLAEQRLACLRESREVLLVGELS